MQNFTKETALFLLEQLKTANTNAQSLDDTRDISQAINKVVEKLS